MLNGIVISVVIPIYNAAGSLGRCLDCLLAQTHEALEIICVNDGSTDASADILEDHAKKDSRIRVITQRNSGAGAARNAGFEAATGKYVIFLDSDDIFEPDMLYSMAERLETTGADAAVCLYDAFDSSTGEPVINCWMPPEELMQLSVFSPTERNDCLYQLVQGWPWDKMFRAEHIRK
ncbi:MAG: glycosyltransferase family 2 protein, partial [Ruminococcaceae bacterium]|nr:glycosyltransferase family 2 protein [Oscillospiraceae bacterium]